MASRGEKQRKGEQVSPEAAALFAEFGMEKIKSYLRDIA